MTTFRPAFGRTTLSPNREKRAAKIKSYAALRLARNSPMRPSAFRMFSVELA